MATQLSGAAAWRLAILDSVAGSYEIERARFADAEKQLTRPGQSYRPALGLTAISATSVWCTSVRLYEIRGNTKAAHEYRALLRSRHRS